MGQASFDNTWANGSSVSPALLVLEVRDRKNPKRPPIGFFAIERKERTCAADRIATGDETIEIVYREIPANGNLRSSARGEFNGSYHAHVNTVSITAGSLTGGMVVIDPPSLQGHGLGTYLMNEIVRWAKRWPNATVNTIGLSEGQGLGENRERRNRFYEQFGLKFEYTSAERKAGTSLQMLAQDLTLVESWKQNISEHNLIEFLGNTLYRKRVLEDELTQTKRTLKGLVAEQRRNEAKPIRWALGQHKSTIFWSGVIVIVGWLIGTKIRG